MGIIQTIRNWWNRLFVQKAEDEFEVRTITSMRMEQFIQRCMNIYEGRPYWLNVEKGIRTINMARSVCEETARLTTLDITITIDGSARAEWLQKQLDAVYYQLREWVELGAECGTVIFKPNGDEIEVITPDRFFVTQKKNGKITGAVFFDQQPAVDGEHYYNRLEFHRFTDDGLYAIDNRAYYANNENETGERIDLEDSPWAGIEPTVYLENMEKPLFGVFRAPGANSIDKNSPLGMPIYSNALYELEGLDIAFSKNFREINDSEKIVFLDSDKLSLGGKPAMTATAKSKAKEEMELPHYVRIVEGDGANTFYQEVVPSLNTTIRIEGMNNMLSYIGYKCGYSNGYFVFDEKTGMVTATQVEADDRRTIQLIKDYRDRLQDAIEGVVYALNAFADLYDLAPVGEYSLEDAFHFQDITYSWEEDKLSTYNLAVQGHYPWEEYYVRFLGYSREEAQTLLAQAQEEQNAKAQAESLFGGPGEE